MNYDLDTKEGMANAVQWTDNMMRSLKDGGTWLVPRSGTAVVMLDYAARKCRVVEGFASDTSIKMVLRASGWVVDDVKSAA